LQPLCQLSLYNIVIISQGKLHILKTESSLTRLCSYQIHGHVIISQGLLRILQAHFFIATSLST
jgi:hypothetical protein